MAYTISQLKKGLVEAQRQGNTDAVVKLAALIRKGEAEQVGQPQYDAIPGGPPGSVVSGAPNPEPTMLDQAVGAGETALAVGTAIPGAVAGGATGLLKGVAQELLAGRFGTQQANAEVDAAAKRISLGRTPTAADRIAAQASLGAEAGAQVTGYQPRTEAGQQQLRAVGEAAQQIPAFIPAAGPVKAVAGAARAGTQAVRDIAPGAAQQAKEATTQAAKVAAAKVQEVTPEPVKAAAVKVKEAAKDVAAKVAAFKAKKAGTKVAAAADTPVSAAADTPVSAFAGNMRSMGAAEVDQASLRQARANELPVPIALTKGQRTRAAEDIQFEDATARDAQLGAPLRERAVDTNAKLVQNIDALFDTERSTERVPDESSPGAGPSETGGQAVQPGAGATVGDRIARLSDNMRELGVTIDSAVRKRMEFDTKHIKALYEKADKAGELRAPTQIPSAIQYLNDVADDAVVAPSLNAIRAKALRLGVATEDANGNLVPKAAPLKTVELFRQAINDSTGVDSREIRHAARLKSQLDTDTEDAGGDIYKQARTAVRTAKQDYVNTAIVKRLLGTKPGTTDRSVSYEAVLDNLILSPSVSVDSLKKLRRLLQTSGSEGMRAWIEIKGAVLQRIKDQATRGVAPNQAGEQNVSPAALAKAINQLDKPGKLDFIFGKRKAGMLRTIRDVAIDAKTIPPNLVNTSGTAHALSLMVDLSMTAASGVPAPLMHATRIAIKSAKNAKTKRKVKEALAPPTQ